MGEYVIEVNGERHDVEAEAATPLLWILRDDLGLTGTKYGCGVGLCGACTVQVAGEAVPSCRTPIASVGERPVRTIEGLSPGGEHPVQRAWMELRVPQCGYCQAGQIMQAAALLEATPHPDDATILRAMRRNLCRCGTYPRILPAVRRAAELAGEDG